MKIKFTVFAAIAALAAGLCAPQSVRADSNFYLHDGDRVVMYGDSITDQRMYSLYTEEFVTTRFPKLKIDWINAGWYGDRVTGGNGGTADVRVQRDVLPYKPTVVTIMLGMNDGMYRAYDQQVYDQYKTGYVHLLDTISQGDPGVRFTLIQPSPYDEITQPPLFSGGYNTVLQSFSECVRGLCVQNNLVVANFNGPVLAMLKQAVSVNPEVAKGIIPDRIHPGPGGHQIMAEALLKSWRAPGVVSSVLIDATDGIVNSAQNTSVTSLNLGNTISWDQWDNSLPMPMNTGDTASALAIKSSDFVDALNRQILQVTGAPAAKYALMIDSTSMGVFTSKQLAAGINLATLETPMLIQARGVVTLAEYHSDLQNRRWRTIQVPLATEPDPDIQAARQEMIKALNNRETEIIANMRAAAQPVSHHFTLAPLP